LPSAYHRYLACADDAFYRPDTEAMQMLLRPLFFTSFLVDDQLADDGLTEGAILLSSASSKTAIAAAFMLAQRGGTELVGLTSARGAAFVEGLGLYDRVVPYEEIGSLEEGPASFVDFAGDAEVRRAVHARYGDALRHSMAVGVTHWEEMQGGSGELPGPPPSFFFAPTRVTKRAADWGRAELEQRVADAWQPFCEWTQSWLEPIPGEGFEAVEKAYLDVLEGNVPPDRAHVLSL
ncbi:MAG TPA: DUF2855 family protein, partial [Solirubrobacterales bacterium]|nr:DUF2855 family protein [Solirubrobacterales bacterium]